MSANDKIILGLIIIGMFACFAGVLAIVVDKYKKKEQEKAEDTIADVEELNQKILQIHDYGDFLSKELANKQSEAMLMYEMLLDKQRQIIEPKKESSQSQTEHHSKGNLGKEIPIPPNTKAKRKPNKVVEQDKTRAEIVKKEELPMSNHNAEIISFHKQGLSSAEIAKKLAIGKGQVELVLHLFVEKK